MPRPASSLSVAPHAPSRPSLRSSSGALALSVALAVAGGVLAQLYAFDAWMPRLTLARALARATAILAPVALLGAVHEGIERLRGITGRRHSPEQGSAAWEAQVEFAKLNGIIRDRLRRLSTLAVDEARAQAGAA